MRNILICRSQKHSGHIDEALRKPDSSLFFEPLFEVIKITAEIEQIKNYEILIVTSANACDAIIESAFARSGQIFAVGVRTAKVLQQAGFNNVLYAKENNAEALYKLILSHSNKRAKMLYLHGSIISFDMVKNLAKEGFDVKGLNCYKIIENERFSENLLGKVAKIQFNEVLLFSKNSAKIFYNLCQKHNMLEYFRSSQIFCLSDEIVREIKSLGFMNVENFTKIPSLRKLYE